MILKNSALVLGFFSKHPRTVHWGQCTPALRTKLKALSNYRTMRPAGDTVTLLKEIKKIVYNFQGKDYQAMAVNEQKKKLFKN